VVSPAAPGVLAVTGSAFRPVLQGAYMIPGGQGGGGTGHGAGSSTDSCVKPDASSTSSNNETTTNNEHSVGQYSPSFFRTTYVYSAVYDSIRFVIKELTDRSCYMT